MTSCCSCSVDSDRGVLDRVTSRRFVSSLLLLLTACHCHRGWGAHPPPPSKSCPRIQVDGLHMAVVHVHTYAAPHVPVRTQQP